MLFQAKMFKAKKACFEHSTLLSVTEWPPQAKRVNAPRETGKPTRVCADPKLYHLVMIWGP